MSDPDTLDDELRNIGKTAPAPAPAAAKPPNKFAKKRGRGRPRKEPIDVHPRNDLEEEQLPTEFDDPRAMEEGGVPAQADVSSIEERIAACLKIEQLGKRLGAVGTGLQPNPHVHPLSVLEDEITLMNAQIGGLHAERVIKLVATKFVAPLIVNVYTAVASAVSTEPPLDLSLFPDEVSNNWDTMFGDAAAQIAINNPIAFGKKGPYLAFIEGAVYCAASAAAKKAARDAATAQSNTTDS